MIRLLPDKSGEVLKARIPPRFAGFFVSVEVREDPPETGVYWYTNWCMLRCIPIREDPCMARRLIGFRNGVFDTVTGKFGPHHQTHWLRTVNSVDFTNPKPVKTLPIMRRTFGDG